MSYFYDESLGSCEQEGQTLQSLFPSRPPTAELCNRPQGWHSPGGVSMEKKEKKQKRMLGAEGKGRKVAPDVFHVKQTMVTHTG